MRLGRRIIWVIALLTFFNAICGCTTRSLKPIRDEIERPGTGLFDDSGQRVNGYMLSNGDRTSYKGWARVSSQDSLEFWHNESVYEPDNKGVRKTVRVKGPAFLLVSVKALDVQVASPGKTIGLLLGILGGLVGAFFISYAANPPEYKF